MRTVGGRLVTTTGCRTELAVGRDAHLENGPTGRSVSRKVDGTVLVGETAEYRGAADPTRLTREFKRRIGGVVPIIIGGSPYSPQSLLARVLSWTVEAATQQQGGPPEQVCVTYPANWGPFKQEIRACAQAAGLP